MQHIEIIKLKNYGDARGAMYSIPDTDMLFLDHIQNIHFGKMRPNAIRGNHYHHHSKEMLIIAYSDGWTLAWAKKDSAEVLKDEFTGSGAVLIKVNEGIGHTVKNTGNKDLEIIALSNKVFSKEDSDTVSKTLLT